MTERVLLLAGDYYVNPPIGIDLYNPKECIRIDAYDEETGVVSGRRPLL